MKKSNFELATRTGGVQIKGGSINFDMAGLDSFADAIIKRELSRDVLWKIDRSAFIKLMADKFLGWKLPEGFWPDGGVSFARTCNSWIDGEFVKDAPRQPQDWPIGTNLLSAEQAEQMFNYCFPDVVEGDAIRAQKG